MDWRFALINGALCAAAIVAAAHVPRSGGRRAALLLAAFLFANWLQYIAAWSPLPPGRALGLANAKDIWPIVDAIGGMLAAGIAFRRWWGWALWAIALFQCVFHAGFRPFGWYDFDFYSHRLDNLMLAQVAVFLLIGGRGIGDRLHSRFGRRRLRGGAVAARAPRAGPQRGRP